MLEIKRIPSFFADQTDIQSKTFIDLHIHTTASDGLITTHFLKKFLKKVPHLISVTDHNTITSNVELYYDSEINIIPGIEVGGKDGFELLVYFKDIEDLKNFYYSHIKPFKIKNKITRTKRDYPYYLKAARKYDSFISIPHISGVAQKNYLKNKDYIHQAIEEVDGIETYNHSLSKKRNYKAKRIRKIKDKDTTLGSDAHIKNEIISFYKLQNNSNFSRSFYLKKNFYNLCSIIALFGKHLHHFID